MEYAFWIWLYLTIGNLGWVIVLLWTVALMGGLIAAFAGEACNFDKDCSGWGIYIALKRTAITALVLALIFSLIASAYPSRTDLAWIVGGAGAIHLAQSEEAQKLPDNVLRAMNSFLEGVRSGGDAEVAK